MPSLLLLTHRVPYPPDRGDRIRSWNLLRHLSQRFEVSLGCLSEEPIEPSTEQKLRSVCRRVAIAPMSSRGKWITAGLSAARGRSLTEGLFWSRDLMQTLRQWSADQPPDVVFVFCSSMLRYADDPALRSVPRVVDLVDVDSEKFYQYAADARGIKRHLYRTEATRVERLEQRAVRDSAAVLLVSEAEAEVLRSRFNDHRPDNIHGINNGVDTEHFSPAEPTKRNDQRSMTNVQQSTALPKSTHSPSKSSPSSSSSSAASSCHPDECQLTTANSRPSSLSPHSPTPQLPHSLPPSPSLVFVGVMNYPPNATAVQWFAAQVWERFRERFPSAVFQIVGRGAGPGVQGLQRYAGIEVLGAVPDVRPHIAAADIVVAPLQIARGIQNKVLEAMSMRRPVIASPAAATGIDAIDGQHLLIAQTPVQWLDQLTRLARDSDLQQTLASNAHQLIHQTYTWPATLAKMDPVLKRLVASG